MTRLQSLEPIFRANIERLIIELALRGINCVVTSGRRTIAEQDKLYAQGRTKPGKIVTKAKGGQSAHNFGLAADLCPLDGDGDLWWNAPDDIWNVMHLQAESLGLVCGYDFKSIVDKPHFEDPAWRAVQAKWRAGEIDVA